MGKSLVIVESPAKAKTINKYLGSQYVVKSSIGHIRDLPTSGSSSSKEPAAKGRKSASEAPALSPKEKARRQLVSRMGVDPEHGWKAKYEILPGKERSSTSCAAWPRTPTPSISRPTWTAKGGHRLAPAGSHRR